jgi:DNA-binding transcriptional LysR family regulator
MMNYRLQVFRSVAECQSISKAARRLHLSQPAVTKHIQLLEEKLHVPLFVRSPLGVSLTPAGILYLEHVQQIAQAHETIAQRLHAPSGELKGRLHLGSNRTILAYQLPAILAAFKSRFPAVVCEITDGNTDTIVGAMLDQRIDLALIEGPCQRTEIQRRTFLEDEIIWIAAPSHPLAEKRTVEPRALLEYPLIVRETGSGSRQFMEAALRRQGLRADRLKIAQEIPHPEAIKRLVIAGVGIGYLFRIGVEQELASGALVKINCPKLTIRRPFSLLTPRGPASTGIARAFAQMLLAPK